MPHRRYRLRASCDMNVRKQRACATHQVYNVSSNDIGISGLGLDIGVRDRLLHLQSTQSDSHGGSETPGKSSLASIALAYVVHDILPSSSFKMRKQSLGRGSYSLVVLLPDPRRCLSESQPLLRLSTCSLLCSSVWHFICCKLLGAGLQIEIFGQCPPIRGGGVYLLLQESSSFGAAVTRQHIDCPCNLLGCRWHTCCHLSVFLPS